MVDARTQTSGRIRSTAASMVLIVTANGDLAMTRISRTVAILNPSARRVSYGLRRIAPRVPSSERYAVLASFVRVLLITPRQYLIGTYKNEGSILPR